MILFVSTGLAEQQRVVIVLSFVHVCGEEREISWRSDLQRENLVREKVQSFERAANFQSEFWIFIEHGRFVKRLSESLAAQQSLDTVRVLKTSRPELNREVNGSGV